MEDALLLMASAYDSGGGDDDRDDNCDRGGVGGAAFSIITGIFEE